MSKKTKEKETIPTVDVMVKTLGVDKWQNLDGPATRLAVGGGVVIQPNVDGGLFLFCSKKLIVATHITEEGTEIQLIKK